MVLQSPKICSVHYKDFWLEKNWKLNNDFHKISCSELVIALPKTLNFHSSWKILTIFSVETLEKSSKITGKLLKKSYMIG